VKLFFRKYGKGKPLVILHGLFGQSDNWNTLAKQFGESGFEAFAIDLRNHGLSPHNPEWNYKVMAEDVLDVLGENDLDHANIIGHSLGGKVAMRMALDHPTLVEKLIVVDIAPKKYKQGHEDVIKALAAMNISALSSRRDAEERLEALIRDNATRMLLLKNLYRKEDNSLAWRFNHDVITKKYKEVLAEIEGNPFTKPTLFILGGNSKHVEEKDLKEASKLFPAMSSVTIPGAGHWVHAEKPEEFRDAALRFLSL